jgi:hypothetical protein
VLGAYVDHYVDEKPHRGLGMAVPAGDGAPKVRATTTAPIERRDVFGGLIHEYRRAAWSGYLNPSDDGSAIGKASDDGREVLASAAR